MSFQASFQFLSQITMKVSFNFTFAQAFNDNNMVRPTKRALVTHSPYTLPRYMLLDLPCDVIRSVARIKLCAHTL